MRRLALTLAIGLLSVAHQAQATPITYTDTVTGTGALGAVTFTSALVTISLVGDTSTVFGDPVPRDFGSATVNVSGVGAATFADPLMWAIDNPEGTAGPLAGIADVTAGLFLLGTVNGAFALYDLRSAIGPISGPVSVQSWRLVPDHLGKLRADVGRGKHVYFYCRHVCRARTGEHNSGRRRTAWYRWRQSSATPSAKPSAFVNRRGTSVQTATHRAPRILPASDVAFCDEVATFRGTSLTPPRQKRHV